MLRNEPPFQPLRLRTVCIEFPACADEASALALAADLAAHASMQRVELNGAPLRTHAALDAVVDAALARELKSFRFFHCRLLPVSAPALARLLGGGALRELLFTSNGQQLLDGPSAALLGAALRANTTLTLLSFLNVGFWRDPDAAAAELLSALTGHPSLCTLNLALKRVAAAHGTGCWRRAWRARGRQRARADGAGRGTQPPRR
jgi:hypothetical protein